MHFTELNDRQRQMILEYVGDEVTSVYTEINLNILTALYDPDKDRYLTLSYYVSSVVTQGDDETGYILIHGDSIGTYTEECDNDAIWKMIRLYESGHRKRETLEKKLLEQYDLIYDGEPVRYKREYLQWYLQNKANT